MKVIFESKKFIVFYCNNKSDFESANLNRFMGTRGVEWSSSDNTPSILFVPYVYNYDYDKHCMFNDGDGKPLKEEIFEVDTDNGVLSVKLRNGKNLVDFFQDIYSGMLYAGVDNNDFDYGNMPHIFYNALDVYWYMLNAEDSFLDDIDKSLLSKASEDTAASDKYLPFLMGYYLSDILAKINKTYYVDRYFNMLSEFCDYLFKQMETVSINSGYILTFKRMNFLYLYLYRRRKSMSRDELIERLMIAFLDNEFMYSDYRLDNYMKQSKLLSLNTKALSSCFKSNDFLDNLVKDVIFNPRENYFTLDFSINPTVFILAQEFDDAELYFLSCLMNFLSKRDLIKGVWLNGKKDPMKGKDKNNVYKDCLSIKVIGIFNLNFIYYDYGLYKDVKLKEDFYKRAKKYINYAWFMKLVRSTNIFRSVRNLDINNVNSMLINDGASISFTYKHAAW